ncbi:hypothetical protein AB0L65_25925 [Nonomuraea sp. NPDC052116]|uniref:hypothetical protein n=1 Tax=Nonomuraea sp. NPDC052116 TaxID=3155665 RepID=UPI003446F2AB
MKPPNRYLSPQKLAADELAEALGALGIPTDVHDGYGLTLVSVWIGLVVWCDGELFWWRSGWDERRKRVIYARHPAEVVELLHSPISTRNADIWLIGEHGRVVATLRNGTLALLELDGSPNDLLGRVRRWSFHWDDLLVHPGESKADENTICLRLGLSGYDREAVQHAVPSDAKRALCGQNAYPLPICGWSLPFRVTSSRACASCAQLAQ